MHQHLFQSWALAVLLTAFTPLATLAQTEPGDFTGSWGFALPDGNGGWLKLDRNNDGEWSGSLLWSVGSAKPVKNIEVADGTVMFTRPLRWKPGGGQIVKKIVGPFRCRLAEDRSLRMEVEQQTVGPDQQPDLHAETLALTAEKISPFPSKPDLSKAQFGSPIKLFNGKDLTGWKLFRSNKKNGWRVENGELVNETPKSDFSAYGSFGNLMTENVFYDFELTIEYNVPAKGNSGIYLRGMYEAQVVDRDSRMQGKIGPGSIFGRIKPPKNVGKPGGQWNKYVLTLARRHITVVLNDELLIDNQPLEGPTGGGILTNDDKPGPIFLQGDHTSVKYRNIVLRPLVGFE